MNDMNAFIHGAGVILAIASAGGFIRVCIWLYDRKRYTPKRQGGSWRW